GLIIYDKREKKYKFLDPFLPSDAIDITDFIDNHRNIVITKSNRKFSIVKNYVHTTDGLNENTFQQMLNKTTTYHSNIYTYPIFKAVQDMLKDIKDRNEECCDFSENKIELANGELFHFILEKRDEDHVNIKGLKKSQDDEWEETQNSYSHNLKYFSILSYQQLNNQDLALITKKGIFIYTIVERSLILRYYWSNDYHSDDGHHLDIPK